MRTKKLDKNLDDLIVNLKLVKPTSVDMFIKLGQSQIEKDEDLPRFNLCESNDAKIDIKHDTSVEDSVIIDNYDDFNCYSFYELKESQNKFNHSKPQEFSFCHHVQDKNPISQSYDDTLSRFSSIVDKLKTEGDSLDLNQPNFFYSYEKDQEALTERNKSNEKIFCFEHQNSQNTERLHTQYFSDTMLKSNQKSYKNMAKKTFQHNFSKPKVQPIYAKLTLPADKQNIHQNSNIILKKSVISNLSSQKSTYSSAIKKNSKKPQSTFLKPTSKPFIPSSSNKQRIKELNQKIRKQNHITYQSEFKQKSSDQTPLQSFKKANIQPHKFSTYKVKLFG